MASALIATDDVEVHVKSGLPGARLEEIIDAIDAEIIRVFGEHDGERTVTLRVNPPAREVSLPNPAASISEVAEWAQAVSPDSAQVVTAYTLLNEGRALRRDAAFWARNVRVTYTPYADNARRVTVLLDLVRWELAYSGHTRTRVGSTETYTPSRADRAVILNRLRQRYGGGGLFA